MRSSTKRRLWFCVLALGGIALLFFGWLLLNFFDAQIRSTVSIPRSDQRSLATALEAYRSDHGVWPAISSVEGCPSNIGSPFPALSTPVAYITAPFRDYFAPRANPARSLACYFDDEGYLLLSVGPDGVLDTITPQDAYRGDDYDGSLKRLAERGWIYDPTNGTRSRGDIVRLRDTLRTERSRANRKRSFGEPYTYDPSNGIVTSEFISRVRE